MTIVFPQQHMAEQQFGVHDLADVLLAINRAYRSWTQGTLDCNLSFTKAAEPGSRIFLWAAAEAVRLSVAWCRQPAFDRVGDVPRQTKEQFLMPLIETATELLSTDRLIGSRLAEDRMLAGDIRDSLVRVFEPQYLLQRQSPCRAAQAILMYRDAAKSRALRDAHFDRTQFDANICEALGCDIEAFVIAATQVRGASEGDEPLLTAKKIVPSERREYDHSMLYARHAEGIVTSAACDVLRLMSGSPHEMVEWTRTEAIGRAEPQDPYRGLLEGPNPLHRFPIVRLFRDKADYAISPLPHLIDEWLYESLAGHLFDTFDFQGKKQLDEVFEEYVGMILEHCSPDGVRWLYESELKPKSGGKVIDWARPFRDSVILVDAKKAFVGLGARYRSVSRDWRGTIEKNWAKAVVQGTAFWSAVERREVPALDKDRGKKPILLIVTWSDTDRRAGGLDVRDAVRPFLPPGLEPIPYVIVSIDRLERVLASWEAADVEWLSVCLADAVLRGAFAMSNSLPAPPTKPRLTAVFEETIKDLTASLRRGR